MPITLKLAVPMGRVTTLTVSSPSITKLVATIREFATLNGISPLAVDYSAHRGLAS